MDKKNIIKRKETKENVVIPISPKKRENENENHIMVDGKKYLHEPDDEFESCCFKCDKPLCLYIGKFSISVAVLLFCFFMLQDRGNSAEFYTGTIAGLLGHYLNTPISQLSSKDKKKEKED